MNVAVGTDDVDLVLDSVLAARLLRGLLSLEPYQMLPRSFASLAFSTMLRNGVLFAGEGVPAHIRRGRGIDHHDDDAEEIAFEDRVEALPDLPDQRAMPRRKP